MAIVTGGGGGIGRAVAHRIARDGLVVAIGDVDDSAATSVAAEISSNGGFAEAYHLDVTSRDGVFDMVDDVVNRHGTLDVMIANAGIIEVKPFEEITTEDWTRVLSVNAEGVLYCIQAAARQMKIQGRGGTILCASSVAGRSGSDLALHYSASKAAVIAMTQAAARSLISHGIVVNAYCPGSVDTDMQRTIARGAARVTGEEEEEYLAATAQRTGLGRFLRPEEIADVVAFMASPAAAGISGQAITIDGGKLFQ